MVRFSFRGDVGMKYTIFGFSQEQVLNLCDEHQSIDERDLMILRWLMDFYFGGMEKRVIDGVEYGWVNASYVCDELPIMHLNTEAVRRRLKKLVKFGLLYHKQEKNSEVGTRAYYRPTEKAVLLQSGTGITLKYDVGTTSKCDHVQLQSSNKDSSINDPSTNNPYFRDDKRAQKKEPRHKYGEYKNVLLTDSDFQKLKDEFPTDWEERIEKLSNYMESKGKAYKNHLATIRMWAKRDAEKENNNVSRETTSGFNRKIDADYYYLSTGDEEVDKVLNLGKYAPKDRGQK